MPTSKQNRLADFASELEEDGSAKANQVKFSNGQTVEEKFADEDWGLITNDPDSFEDLGNLN